MISIIKNLNELDDSPDNLQKLTSGNHITLHHKNKMLSQETKDKISLASKKNPYHHSDKAKRKIGLAHKGKIISESTRKKISIAKIISARKKHGFKVITLV
jgi:hypothetical protein